ncbi:MAG: protein kinase [Acidobacteriota bacterium]|nr:protein kinase [Acidobacteriota bacterium]
MLEVQKYLEGQTADGRYPLVEILGSTSHGSAFRTEHAEAPNRQAVIKLIPAPAATSGARLTRWRLAARFSHPALLRIFDMGRCEIEGRPTLYVVMELAEENLAEILPVRCLSPGEVSSMLAPALEALTYLHGKGFVHGRLQPSNILAIGDQVKLSSDSIVRIGEAADSGDSRGVFRAPETSVSAATDVWSLGATVVQCLTGRVPDHHAEARNKFTIPPSIPAPFFELARHCLNPVPQRRWTIAQIQAALGLASGPATASAPEPADAAPMPAPANDPPASAFAKPAAAAPTRLHLRFRLNKKYRLALAALAAGSAAFALGVVISGGSSDTSTSGSAPVVASAKIAHPSAPVSRPALASSPKRAIEAPVQNAKKSIPTSKAKAEIAAAKAPNEKAPTAQSARAADRQSAVIVTSAPPAPATAPEATAHASDTARPFSPDLIPGAVSRRAIPRVPPRASDTIWGTVRVSVIVDVDPRGHVVEAKLDSPGPSRYFARLSMAAAQDWKFSPPRVDGNIVPSEWVIDFGYSKSDISATAAEKHP